MSVPCCTEEGLPDPEPMTAEAVARVAKALGHPARIQIVDQFRVCTPHVAGEIAECSPLAASTVSEHLRILRDAGVVFVRKDGPRYWYCLRRSVLRDFTHAVEGMAVGPAVDQDAIFVV